MDSFKLSPTIKLRPVVGVNNRKGLIPTTYTFVLTDCKIIRG